MNSKGGPKVAALVINAIRRLQDVQGSTTKEINNYIAQEYNIPNKDIRRQVQLALRRGLSYGILQRAKGGYYVCNKLSPTNALDDVQDESAFCCKYMGKKKRKVKKMRKSSCKRPSRKRSRSRKAGCGPKKKPRRRSMKRKCVTRRSRSRSKKRSRKSKRGCKPIRRSRSMKRRKSRRSQSRRRCPPKKPRKCDDIDMNNSRSENEKGGNNASNTSLISGTNPGRQASSNRCSNDD